jgi:hypothetical protein
MKGEGAHRLVGHMDEIIRSTCPIIKADSGYFRLTFWGRVDSDVRCNPVDSIGSSAESRVSHSEPPPSARFPRDKDGSARRNIEPLQ